MDRDFRHGRPSFFFPIVLITAGVVWLLVNNGTIPVENLYRLVPYWPLLLILAGLSLMIRRIWWPLNFLIWGGAAVLVVWLLTGGSVYLPKLQSTEMKHETLSETIGQAKSARVTLDLSIFSTTVHKLSDSNDLISADVYSINGLMLDASGGDQKNITLRSSMNPNNFIFNPRIDQWFDTASKTWDIGLTPKIPLDLTVDVGTGSTKLNLDGLNLTNLRVDGGTGSIDISLPAVSAQLPVKIDGGTGSVDVKVAANTPVELNVNGGTGGLQVSLPAGAGVQVDVRSGGLGGLNLPPGFTKVRGDTNDKEGTYENAAFKDSKSPIKIILDIGTGGVTIH